jgi:hypothetical protein
MSNTVAKSTDAMTAAYSAIVCLLYIGQQTIFSGFINFLVFSNPDFIINFAVKPNQQFKLVPEIIRRLVMCVFCLISFIVTALLTLKE